MDFYIINNDSTFQFPVNPTELTVEGEKQIETIDIIDIGEVDIPTGNKRAGIRFSSFFPIDYDAGYCSYPTLPDPLDAITTLEKWRDDGIPVRLLITGAGVNDLVLITSVTRQIVGGEVGDIYFDIAFRTWKEIKVGLVLSTAATAKIASVASNPRPDPKPVPKTYKVVSGDSLWKIAKTQLGDGSRWTSIYNLAANKSLIGPDPGKIYPGQALVMPA